VISLSATAEIQVDDLIEYYESKHRDAASKNLLAALETAKKRIAAKPEAGIPAPRPYPFLAAKGLRWIKEGSYWISYSKDEPPVIFGVFHESADIPNRL
jgi:plasmid stabilization system protein ParE